MKKYFIKSLKSSDLDENAQPLNMNFNRLLRTDRDIDELIGICKGITADNIVSTEEALYLERWLKINKEIANQYPANMLIGRIETMLIDGVFDDNEKLELLSVLQDLTGERPSHEICDNYSTALPFDQPFPEVVFRNNLFCLTGKFCYGTRNLCESEIIKRAGQVQSNPTLKTNYLVIGILGSSDWIHTTHGRKIEKAVEYRDKGLPIKIIPEEHWVNSIQTAG
ncbi:MAG: DNA polymerase III subunit epsilon [Syntrophorhabdus sp. PtaU1.Bin058]|nr:MAG: DNA polymerase III subunit epsilon [Syntrophorhabdus sp. PtaU1.Bin058]